jgi:polar amino acid transport system permease protein
MSALWLESGVALARRVGLKYGFLLDAAERSAFLQGMLVTLELAAITIACSLVAGVVLTAMLVSRQRVLASTTRAFVELTRNTPTLVQLYCGFLVLNMLISQALQPYGTNPMTPFIWVVLVVSLHKAAFHAEALRAGLEAIPSPTLEAAASLGFSRRKRLWLVQMPLALRFAMPAIVNNLVDLVKMTAVASAIAVGDVTYQSIMIWTQRDNVLELMLLILLYFGALTFGVSRAGRLLETRLRIPGYGQ